MIISCSAQKKIFNLPSEGSAITGGYWSPATGLCRRAARVDWQDGKISCLTVLEEGAQSDEAEETEEAEGTEAQKKVGTDYDWKSYLLQPGWIDAHVHLALDSLDFYQCLKNWEDPSLIEKNMGVYLEDYLKSGFTAIRDGGDLPGFAWQAKKRVMEKIWPGPRIVSVREAVNRKGMYGRFLGRGFANVAEWQESSADFYGQGLDQLKVVVSGLIRFDQYNVVGPTQWSAAELRQITESAHRRGILVMAHASGEEGIAVAIAGGVDSVEHGYYMNSQLLEQMKQKGIAWVPTVAPIGNILKYPTGRYSPQEIDILQRILDSQLKTIYKAYQSGVRLGVGTDAGAYLVPHSTSFFDELDWLIQAGIPKLEVYSLATRENAGILGQDDLGRLETGTPLQLLQLADISDFQ